MGNKFNFLIAFLLMFSSQLVFSQDSITVTGTRGPAGGGATASMGTNVYNRTEAEAKKAGEEAAAKAEKESREKSRQECLTREMGQIATDELACQQRYDLGYAADIGACNADGYQQCKDKAGATQSAGYKGCAVDASQKKTDLPEAFVCKR